MYKPIYENIREKFYSNFLEEIKILYKLNHPNVVRIYNYYAYEKECTGYILMEYIEGKNIYDYFNDYIGAFGSVTLNQVFFQLIEGFVYIQKAIIEEFAPRFAPKCECLYVGDTIKKDLVKNTERLSELGFEITLHDKMPDVVLYREDENWIYFVESVTSVGPMDSKRILEIDEMTKNVNAGKIFVTAFLDFKTYKKFSESLAWETEVWIAEMPEHMIHLNGDKFLGPR